MRSDSGAAPALDLRAVGIGVIWALVVLVLGAFVQALVGLRSPLSESGMQVMTLGWQVLAGLFGGIQAARRAAGSGWLHGALAGAALVLVVAAIMGISSALPGLAALLKMAGIGIGSGAVGGIAGVNLGRR